MLLQGFEPVADSNSRVLILGSMPSEASLAGGFYYGHPRNAFWWLLAELFGCEVPADIGARRQLLLDHHIALWDVVWRCRRPGSLDSAIDAASVQPNDIAAFLAIHPGIGQLFFNGSAAETLFRRHVRTLPRKLVMTRLPSSSPANASWSRERKLAAWRAVVRALDSRVSASHLV